MEYAKQGKELEIDLPNQTIKGGDFEIKFEVSDFRKECLVKGLDEIGQTLEKLDMIEKFEEKRSEVWPWLDGKRFQGKVVPRKEKKLKTDW